MSSTCQENDLPQTTPRPKPRFPSKPSRPAWALAWSSGESIALRPEQYTPFTPSFQSFMPSSAPPIRSVTPEWDDEEVKPNASIPDNPPPAATRPSSRLSDHLTQDQEERQAMSNDLAGRRALPTMRTDSGPPVSEYQNGKEGITSSAVTVHGWEEDDAASSTRKASSQAFIGPGYPRLEPSRVYQEMLQRETVRPPVFGGRSKNMQLGSVAESWGKPPTAETPRGMFQLADDPPSPPPGVNMSPEEIQAEKARRAMLGIPGEKSGRPSIKDMEKEIMDKMRAQRLREERVRSEIDVRELRPEDRASIQGSGWSQSVRQSQPEWPSQQIGQDRHGRQTQPSRQNSVQPSLSERIRERDVYNQGVKQDDGW